MAEDRQLRIQQTLRRELAAVHVDIEDHSERHAGHEGASEGAGHFVLVVVSDRFRGLSRIAAQRLVYSALGDMMGPEIHALSMRTFTPEDWENR